jgi:putative phosphoesterase
MPRGERRLPDACVRELERADLILHAGDLTGADFLAELERFARVEAVRGNMDDAALQDRLPLDRVVEAGALSIGMVHIAGPRAGREARLAARFPGCDAVVYGDTHVPQVDRHEGVWILNPGSPTDRRRASSRSMLVVEVAGKKLIPTLVPFT